MANWLRIAFALLVAVALVAWGLRGEDDDTGRYRTRFTFTYLRL